MLLKGARSSALIPVCEKSFECFDKPIEKIIHDLLDKVGAYSVYGFVGCFDRHSAEAGLRSHFGIDEAIGVINHIAPVRFATEELI